MSSTAPDVPVDPRLAPRYVRKELALLAAETGVEPTVSQPEPGTWHITADNGRVRMVSTYNREHASPGGANNWVNATLAIDGLPRPVDHPDDVADAFFCPDDVLAARPPRPATVAAWTAPEPVRAALKALRPAFTPAESTWGATPAVGRIGRRWVLAADTDRIALRIHFYPFPGGRWAMAQHRGIELVVDGVDRGMEVGRDVTRLASVLSSVAPTSDASGSTRGAATTPTSVQVRTTVVRRT